MNSLKCLRRNLVLALMVASSLLITACDLISPPTTWDHISQANAFMEKRDYRSAIIELRNAVQLEPDNPGARVLLGTAYEGSYDFVSAEKELSRALALGAAPVDVNPVLSRTLLQLQQYQTLLEQVQPIDGMSPTDLGQIYLDRADAQIGLRQLDAAAATIQSAEALDVWPQRVLVTRAKLRLAHQDAAQALTLVDQALIGDPDMIPALYIRAALLAAKGEYEPALKAYQHILELDEGQLVAHLDMISAKLALGQTDDLQRHVDAAQRINGKDLRVLFASAQVAFFQGKFAEVDKPLQDLLSENPDYLPALLLNSAVAYSQGSYEVARRDLVRFTAQSPTNSYPYKLLALVQLALGEPKNALETLRTAALFTPDDAQAEALAAEAQMVLGNWVEANERLEKAMTLTAGTVARRQSLAGFDLNRSSEALMIKAFDEVVSSNPSFSNNTVLTMVRRLSEKDVAGAAQAIQTLNDRYGETPMVWSIVGYLKLVAGNDDAARSDFDTALKLDPAYYPAVANLALLDIRSGNAQAARQRFKTLLEADQANVPAMVALAMMSAKEKDEAGFVRWLNKAIEANPGAITPARLLVEYHIKKARPGDALAVAEAAYSNNAQSPAAAELVGAAHAAAGDNAAAEAVFARLVEVQPYNALYHYKLGASRAAQSKWDVARESLFKALALKPDFADAWDRLILVEVDAGNQQAALEVARKMQSLFPQSPVGYEREGDVAFSAKSYPDAVMAYEAALSHGGGEAAAIKRFLAQERRGDGDGAEAALQAWADQHPEASEARHYLAAQRLQTGDRAAATAAYEAMLERFPDDLMAANNLAWLYLDTDPVRAEATARGALESAPDSAQIKDTLGWIWLKQGKTQEAVALLFEAAGRSDAPGITYHYAAALSQAGRSGEAKAILEKLLGDAQRFPERAAAQALLDSL